MSIDTVDHIGSVSSRDYVGAELAIFIVRFILAAMAIAGRVAALRLTRSSFEFNNDDWCIFAAMVVSIAYFGVSVWGLHTGAGKHLSVVKDRKPFFMSFLVKLTTYNLTVLLTKMSILWMCDRLFNWKHKQTTRRIISLVLVAIIFTYTCTAILFTWLQVSPLSSLWTEDHTHRLDLMALYRALGWINVFMDFAILCMPIQDVLRLHRTPANKAQLLVTFLLSGIVCVFGTIRAVSITKTTIAEHDFSYSIAWGSIWSYMEASIGIVAGCVSLFRIFVTKLVVWTKVSGNHSPYTDSFELRTWPGGSYTAWARWDGSPDAESQQRLDRATGPVQVHVRQDVIHSYDHQEYNHV